MDRRTFLRTAAAAGAAAFMAACGKEEMQETASESIPAPTEAASTVVPTQIPVPSPTPAPERSTVFLIRSEDRVAAVRQAFEQLAPDFSGKRVLIKPNFNSADPPPGSTDPAMLEETIRLVHDLGADRIQIGDRSGMASTRQVMQRLGVPAMMETYGVEWIDFSGLPADQWERVTFEGSHWPDGFAIAKPVMEAEGIVSLCCLKTHRFGGHFTLSLKNSVGMVASEIPGTPTAYMQQLHGSSFQRSMIAEVNTAYKPDVVIIDGVAAFTTGGPDTGTLVYPGVVLAGTDRIALDAVGVALLRMHGTTPEVSRGSIFEQEQIRRAIELGLGVTGPERIELRGDMELVERVQAELFAA
ncbi:MAG: DUF362 domain-containing protein [Anaerolineales bacterium]|nr:DUF362 domain-containing protein [Anaerolineales bacterium]